MNKIGALKTYKLRKKKKKKSDPIIINSISWTEYKLLNGRELSAVLQPHKNIDNCTVM
jgi:hypothetical protein